MSSKQHDLFGFDAPAGKVAPAKSPEKSTKKAPVEPPAAVAAVEVKAVEPAPVDPPAQGRWRTPSAPVVAQPAGPRVYSVGELTVELKSVLENTWSRVFVRGEVTGFRGANASGHLYFAIKDNRASMNVVLFKGSARSLKFALRDGLSVIIEGALNLYEPQGRYSLVASRIEPEGVGARALAFEQLKQKLAAEGLFGDKRTRPRREIPVLPRRIGVVTSISGAALRDFLKVVHRRHPQVSVLVADARMQGDAAEGEIVRALRWLSRQDLDVVVLTRGGGSVEDLWTFNSEAVARAIFACPVPVVSAIGHEIDVTIADLVADVRAPTPSAAAEQVVPVLSELLLHLQAQRARVKRSVDRELLHRRQVLLALKGRLADPRRLLADRRLELSELEGRLLQAQQVSLKERQVQLRTFAERISRQQPHARLQARREHLAGLALRLQRQSPEGPLREARLKLGHQSALLSRLIQQRVARARQGLQQRAQHLDALSPLKVLTRGYALVQTAKGEVVRSTRDVAAGDEVRVRVADGQFDARVTKK